MSPGPATWPCPACGVEVTVAKFACPKDWKRLPARLREAIGVAWQARCKGKPGGTLAHVEAKQAAVVWFKAHPR